MSERNLDEVDPSLRETLSVMPDFSRLGLTTLEEYRALMVAEPPLTGQIDGVEVTRIETVNAAGRPVAGYLYQPSGAASGHPAVLNIHGGGYVMGMAGRDQDWSLRCARTLGCTVFSTEYAKAPEAPYPAAADDVLAALEWLNVMAAELGIDTARIAVRGASAGGGLAAGLTVRTRGRDDLAIAFLVLIYPMLDHRPAPPERAGRHVWPREANEYGWAALLGEAADAPSPVAVPALASDLSRFPPTYIAVGDIDLFVSENLAFAARLVEASVETELHVYPGAYHGFTLIADSPLAQRADADAMTALSRALAR